jgi:hypothetical protein
VYGLAVTETERSGEFEQADGVQDWRVLEAGASAWFGAPSMSAGAALVRRIAGLASATGLPDLDLRQGGVRVRISPAGDLTPAGVELARSISAAAGELGLTADPAVLQSIQLVIDTVDRSSVVSFWQTVLGYEPVGAQRLVDPSRRQPGLSFHDSPPRPLPDRIHVDVVRPADAVEAARAAVGQEPSGPFGVALVDADGNVVDVVPGDRLSTEEQTADWQALFGAMAHYPVDSPVRAGELASAVAALADEAGVPLMVDLRPDGVTIDSGKDQWEEADGSADGRFVELAGRIQAAARGLGLSADLTRPRFVQFGIAAVDPPVVRAFWASVLGYEYDPRAHLTDIYDPRRLNPVLFFQQMDASDAERRAHRNRLHLDLFVPHDQAKSRIDVAVAAGGRIAAEDAPDRWTVMDPEGNELRIVTSGGEAGR